MSTIDQLKELSNLKTAGVLTEAEFEMQKAQILSGGADAPAVSISMGSPVVTPDAVNVDVSVLAERERQERQERLDRQERQDRLDRQERQDRQDALERQAAASKPAPVMQQPMAPAPQIVMAPVPQTMAAAPQTTVVVNNNNNQEAAFCCCDCCFLGGCIRSCCPCIACCCPRHTCCCC